MPIGIAGGNPARAIPFLLIEALCPCGRDSDQRIMQEWCWHMSAGLPRPTEEPDPTGEQGFPTDDKTAQRATHK